MNLEKKEIIVSRNDAKSDISDNESAYRFWNDQIILQQHVFGRSVAMRAVFKYRQFLPRTILDKILRRRPVVDLEFSTSDLHMFSILKKGEEVGYTIAKSSCLLLFVTKEDEKRFFTIPDVQRDSFGVCCLFIPNKGFCPYIEVDCTDIVTLKFISRIFTEA